MGGVAMYFHTVRYTPVDNHKPSIRREAGNLLAILLFWAIMLGLLSSPFWLPLLVELLFF
jgi:hypothetical protein